MSSRMYSPSWTRACHSCTDVPGVTEYVSVAKPPWSLWSIPTQCSRRSRAVSRCWLMLPPSRSRSERRDRGRRCRASRLLADPGDVHLDGAYADPELGSRLALGEARTEAS